MPRLPRWGAQFWENRVYPGSSIQPVSMLLTRQQSRWFVRGECAETSHLAGESVTGCAILLRTHTAHNWPRHWRAQYAQYVPHMLSPRCGPQLNERVT
jgi:hypothetical protein